MDRVAAWVLSAEGKVRSHLCQNRTLGTIGISLRGRGGSVPSDQKVRQQGKERRLEAGRVFSSFVGEEKSKGSRTVNADRKEKAS